MYTGIYIHIYTDTSIYIVIQFKYSKKIETCLHISMYVPVRACTCTYVLVLFIDRVKKG